MEKANTIKFTAKMSETEITFLDTKVYKGIRFNKEPILEDCKHINQPGAHEPTYKSLSRTRCIHQA